jgi:hypothetical protein
MADPTPGMVHEDSIDSQDPRHQEEKKSKSRRPASEEPPADMDKARRLKLTVGFSFQTLHSVSND